MSGPRELPSVRWRLPRRIAYFVIAVLLLAQFRPDLVRLYERELGEMERMRAALTGGAYPGMGTGDPDLYKAFSWRFWTMVAGEGGRVGVLLPRIAMSAKGSETFRKEVFPAAADIDLTLLLNNRQWRGGRDGRWRRS
jgi:hypothetical protein